MRRIASFLALSLAASVASAQTVRIEFEATPGPDGVLGTADDVPIVAPTTFGAQPQQLTDEFMSLGLRFTPNPATNDMNEVLDAASFTTPAGHTPPNLFASSGTLMIRGSFTVPVSRVGALIGISGGSDELQIFDAGGASLGTIVGDDAFVFLTSTTPIASFAIRAFTSTTPAIDNLEFDIAAPTGPTNYCTAGTTTNLCTPAISATAQPSVTFANPCDITIANVEGQKSGLIFYGVSGTVAFPWAPGSSSFFCVKSPTLRTPVQGTGGLANACDGVMTLDWNAFQMATPGALGQPWTVGAKAHVQGWFRDPPAIKTTNLSDGLELTYAP